MKQFIFIFSILHMLLSASIGTLIVVYLSPEKLAPTRLNWLSTPDGVLLGVVLVAVATVIPFGLLLIIDDISHKDGKRSATKQINENYFLIKK